LRRNPIGGMIGSFLYLTASRPDIIFSVHLCARFQSNPKETHLKAVKWILRNLKCTSDELYGIPKGALLISLRMRIPIIPDS